MAVHERCHNKSTMNKITTEKLLSNDPLLRELVADLRLQSDLVALWVYGSRATGSAQANSDYDLAAAFSNHDEPAYNRRMKPELVAIDLYAKYQIPISLVDISLCPLPLAINIIEEGVVLTVLDEQRYLAELSRTDALWENQKLQQRASQQ